MDDKWSALWSLLHAIAWYFKQLLPLQYVTEYGENEKLYVAVWRMWFGRCFNIEEWEVVGRKSKETENDYCSKCSIKGDI
jgi:hypothetical protein